jgi:hypothetical protein
MANTVISLRSSGATGNTPSLGVLANGELSLNFADGILYYKTAANALGSIRTTQVVGLNKEIQFNDAGSFGSNASLTFDKANTTLTTNNFVANTITTGTGAGGVISGANVIYANTFVANTGGYVQFADGSKQYSANAGSTTLAQAAFDFANTANIKVDSAYAFANIANIKVDSVYAFANIANIKVDAAFTKANAANVLAQAAFDKANTDATSITATAGTYGNATYVPVITLAANGRISSITNTAISGGSSVDSVARTTANAAFDKANSACTAAASAQSTATSAQGAAASAQSTADAALGTDYTTVSAPTGTYGSATLTPIVTVAANGRITDISTIATSGSGGSSSDYFPTDNNWGYYDDTIYSAFGELLMISYDCRIDPITPTGYTLTKDFGFLT